MAGRIAAEYGRRVKTFDCVVAADRKHGIGANHGLPWPKLKTDVKHFRELTTAAPAGKRNAVIMGRKTWDTVPPKFRPLPDRWNLIISRGAVELAGDARLARSLDEALALASAADDVDQIFVIGGAEIYRQAFEHVRCRDVVLTRIDGEFESDTHIPDVTERFDLIERGTTIHESGYDYAIERWRRRGR